MAEHDEYRYLQAKQGGSNYRRLFVNGRIRADVVYRETIGRKALTPVEVAHEYNLPLEAVLEAIDYCQKNEALLDEERNREEAWIRASGHDQWPYASPIRRLLQFRLRTLLIALSLLCLFFATFGRILLLHHRETMAADKLAALGGRVSRDDLIPTDASLITRWFLWAFLDAVHPVRRVDLTRSRITDSDLSDIGDLSGLEFLCLNSTAITDAGLDNLRTLSSLRYLHLQNCVVSRAKVDDLQKALPNCIITCNWIVKRPTEREVWP